MKPIYVTSKEVGYAESYCTCCGRDLNGHAIRMLELDQRIDAYHDFGGVPVGNSQGWFPFGMKCAKREIAKAIDKGAKAA